MYDVSGVAVKAEKEAVLEKLKDFFSNLGGEISEAGGPRGTSNLFKMSQENDWTIIAFGESGLNPQLPVFLSNSLNTKVISVDAMNQVDYEHFSVVDNGDVKMVYTGIGGEVRDGINLDIKEIVQQAVDKGVLDVPAGMEKEELDWMVFEAFNKTAEVNVEELANKVWSDESLPTYEYRSDAYNKNRMGYEGPLFWTDLARSTQTSNP